MVYCNLHKNLHCSVLLNCSHNTARLWLPLSYRKQSCHQDLKSKAKAKDKDKVSKIKAKDMALKSN